MIHYRYIYIALVICFLVENSILSQSFIQKTIPALSMMSENYGNAVVDFDQDGDLDIFMVGYQSFDKSNPKSWSRLLENRGSGRLVDVTEDVGLSNQFSRPDNKDNKIGVAWGDYDADGFPDLLLTHANSFQLLKNNQGRSFSDMTLTAGLLPVVGSVYTSALWWDYNNDAHLDLYISNYQGLNTMYENQGDGTFADVGQELKLQDQGSAWSSIALDVNRDGWQDLYVINDYGLSRLYINEQGQFSEQTLTLGLRNTGNGMGASIGDYNNDGYFDIYVTNIADLLPNVLFTGTESGVYTENAHQMKVGHAGWAWGVQFFDADHDMDEDLYIVNGFNDLQFENRFYKNMLQEDGGSFIDWSVPSHTNQRGNGMGVEVFDYDDDGDLDMLVSNTNSSPYLYENIGAAGNWLKVNLQGADFNVNALGTTVRVSAGAQHIYRYHHGAAIMSQSIKPIHFGLADVEYVDSITVTWPNSNAEVYYNTAVNQSITLTEDAELRTATIDREILSDFADAQFELVRYGPNPSEGDLQFIVQTKEPGEIRGALFSLQGQCVAAFTEAAQVNQLQMIDLSIHGDQHSPIASGLYIFKIQMDRDHVIGKIVIE